MSNQIYANNMEVSCKQAAGKSICAFPDVCFTPPMTPVTPPGVPIPYPNTGMASDTTDGSTSVKISGQEVMLKNKSCFKRSMGDEAGCATKKGVVTSKNMGKVYFNAWSMDVRFEGENVVRTLDLTTHNHASLPGNSLAWPYLDEMSSSQATETCGKERKAVETACENCTNNDHAKVDCPALDSKASKQSGYRDHACVKAKRCMLVPFSRRNNQKGGCCPGQTAHHIIPKHHFPPEKFKEYDGNDALCVCVEGYSWHRNCASPFETTSKTHADMHDIQDGAERMAIGVVEEAIEDGYDVGHFTPEYAMNYGEARDVGIDAHKQCFPDCDPACSEKCLAAQIDAYHKHKDVGIADDTLIRTKRVGVAAH